MEGESPGEPIHLNGEAELDAAVAEHDRLLVDFHADWCGPCQMMNPTLEAFAAETDVTVAKVDVDENQALASAYGVRGIPNLLYFADGEQVQQLTGLQQRETLDRLVEQYA
ncbi:thioredoxin [Halosegnis marinus]|uniref:thioredoxin n=1 Tax=Halosegnis marinus TaxID=3034023 RepID=UPI0036210EDC